MPGSHKTYTPRITHKNDWIVCDNQETLINTARKLLIPENSLVNWNFRLIHANEPPTFSKKEFNQSIKEKMDNITISNISNINLLNRVTAYVTYLPKYLSSELIKEKGLIAIKAGNGTSHWANKCEIKRFPYGFKSNYLKRNIHSLV